MLLEANTKFNQQFKFESFVGRGTYNSIGTKGALSKHQQALDCHHSYNQILGRNSLSWDITVIWSESQSQKLLIFSPHWHKLLKHRLDKQAKRHWLRA